MGIRYFIPYHTSHTLHQARIQIFIHRSSGLLPVHQLRHQLAPLRLLLPLLLNKTPALIHIIFRAYLQNDPRALTRAIASPLRRAVELVSIGIPGTDEGEPVGNKLFGEGKFNVGLRCEGEGAIRADEGRVSVGSEVWLGGSSPSIRPLEHHPVLRGVVD